MILVDYSQMVISNFFVSTGGNPTMEEVDEGMIRNMVMNSIRKLNTKFKPEYGNLVMCCDNGKSWRKEIFPYYKAMRAKNRQESNIDWSVVYGIFDKIKKEINDVFPYKVIDIKGVEADDIIGTISIANGVYLGEGKEKILIVSSDKDFIQLHRYSNVFQWSNAQDKFVVHSDPEEYLKVHILKGDSGDGIPNVLSEGNVFVTGKRQTVMTKKRLDILKESLENGKYPDGFENIEERISRNKMLIDLNYTPDHIKEQIHFEFNKEKETKKKSVFNYFFEHGLKNQMEFIGDFK